MSSARSARPRAAKLAVAIAIGGAAAASAGACSSSESSPVESPVQDASLGDGGLEARDGGEDGAALVCSGVIPCGDAGCSAETDYCATTGEAWCWPFIYRVYCYQCRPKGEMPSCSPEAGVPCTKSKDACGGEAVLSWPDGCPCTKPGR